MDDTFEYKPRAVAWFSTLFGTMGLVVGENKHGQLQAYLGQVPGNNQTEDIKVVMDWGCKLYGLDAALALVHANAGGGIPEKECTHLFVHMKGRALFDNEIRNIETMWCARCHKCRPVPTNDKQWSAADILAQYGHEAPGKDNG